MAESSSQTLSSCPSIDEFAETLQEEERWYQLGIFMGAPMSELKAINDMKSQAACDILMLLIHLYDCLERKGRPLTWEAIATALRRLGNHALAEKVHSRHHNRPTQPAIVPQDDGSTNPNPNTQHPVTNSSSNTMVQEHTITPSTLGTTSTTSHTTVGTNDSSNDAGAVIVKHEYCPIFNEYHSLDETFNELLIEVKNVFVSERICLDVVQDVLRRRCGLPPLPQEKTTPNAVFTRVEEQCSIINFRILVFLVKSLKLGNTLLEQFEILKGAVDRFKSSANMVELVELIKSKQTTPTGEQKMVKLKVREFWSKFTMEQFEIIINEIFLTLYDIMTCVTVTKGCICLNWIIPDIDTTELLPVLPLELVRLIGVIYLHIGSNVIYNIEGEGCESIEAAMIQAIELKNTRAIELLLAVGCNPKVATYNGDNAVTNIVNIRAIESKESSSSGSSHSVDHVCILGHNKHVEAIVDPACRGSEPEECNSCIMKEKMVKHLHQEVDNLYQKQKQLCSENDLLSLAIKNKDSELEELKLLRAERKRKLIATTPELVDLKKRKLISDQSSPATPAVDLTVEVIKMKDAEITLMKKSFEALKKEMTMKDEENHRLKNELKSHLSILRDRSTAVLPCRWRRVGIKAEMKVKVITRDNSSGKELATGGSEVRAILTCNEGECPVTDNNDGTYTVSVIPQQLGQHQLSITVNGGYIQGSPFSFDIVPQRDYTKLDKPVQTITDIIEPRCIAFANNGDMFVTSSSDNRIHVYDASGNKKTTIGPDWGRGRLPIQSPRGIDINGEVVYVADRVGNRIFRLTTGGELIGSFVQGGGQFSGFYDVKISPDGKIYVADKHNYRVRVFNPDWSESHVINGTVSSDVHIRPEGIGFDPLSGDVHVTGFASFLVAVFTSSGQFVRYYGDDRYSRNPSGIAIDSSGYCLVIDYQDNNARLSVFDSRGKFIHSVDGFKGPCDVSISPVDGSVWVADTGNNRLIMY